MQTRVLHPYEIQSESAGDYVTNSLLYKIPSAAVKSDIL
jgi:hypothetical protein